MRLIDSHCHIDGDEFDGDRAEVLARARAAEVSPVVVVGTGDPARVARAPALAERERDVVAAVGYHPHDAAKITEEWWDSLEALAAGPRVVAIGETGLDLHYRLSSREAQIEALRRQVRIARALGKPIICHVREAHADTLAVLDEEHAAEVGVVIHCFTGTPGDAAACVARGFYVSFSGIVTFTGRSADPIRAAVRAVPLNRILIETDSPYLAPVPHRGARNEPSFLVHTAHAVAREAGVTAEELAAASVANASALFRLTP